MLNKVGKMLFPALARDQRKRRMNTIILVLIVGVLMAAAIGLGMFERGK